MLVALGLVPDGILTTVVRKGRCYHAGFPQKPQNVTKIDQQAKLGRVGLTPSLFSAHQGARPSKGKRMEGTKDGTAKGGNRSQKHR